MLEFKKFEAIVLKGYYRGSRVRTFMEVIHAIEYIEVSFLEILMKAFLRNGNS